VRALFRRRLVIVVMGSKWWFKEDLVERMTIDKRPLKCNQQIQHLTRAVQVNCK